MRLFILFFLVLLSVLVNAQTLMQPYTNNALSNIRLVSEKIPPVKNALNKGVLQTKRQHTNQAMRLFKTAYRDTLPYKALNNMGVLLANKEQTSGAIQRFTQSLQQGGNQPQIYYNRALAYCSMGQYQAAQPDFEQSGGASLLLNANQGICFLQQHNYTAAIACFGSAIEQKTQQTKVVDYTATMYYYRSLAYKAQGQADSALTDLEQSVKYHPKTPYPYIGLGYAYSEQQNWAKTKRYYEQGLQKGRNSEIARQGLADAYLALQKPIKAKHHYNKLIEQLPKEYLKFGGKEKVLSHRFTILYNGQYKKCQTTEEEAYLQEILVGIGNTACTHKDYSKAIDYYNLVLRINPQNTAALTGKGHVYCYKVAYEKAVEQYSLAIAIDTSYDAALNGRGIAEFRLQQYTAALQDLLLADKLAPNAYQNYDTYISKGFSYLQLYNYDDAEPQFDAAININPKNAAAYNGRGIALYGLGNRAAALKDFNKAIKLDPSNSDSYTNRGILYYHDVYFDKAAPDFCKAIQLNKNQVDAYCGRGFAYSRLGKYENAYQDFTTAIQLKPNTAELYSNRAWVSHSWALFSEAKQGKEVATVYYNAAFADLDTAMLLDPIKVNHYLNNRGIIHKDQGDYAAALADLGDIEAIAQCNNRAIIMALQNETKKASDIWASALLMCGDAEDLGKATILANRIELGSSMPLYSDLNDKEQLGKLQSSGKNIPKYQKDAYSALGYYFLQMQYTPATKHEFKFGGHFKSVEHTVFIRDNHLLTDDYVTKDKEKLNWQKAPNVHPVQTNKANLKKCPTW